MPDIPKSTKERARKLISFALIKNTVENDITKKRPGFIISPVRKTSKESTRSSQASPVLSPRIIKTERANNVKS